MVAVTIPEIVVVVVVLYIVDVVAEREVAVASTINSLSSI